MQLLESLRDENLLLVDDCAIIVPFGNIVTEIEILNQILGMFHRAVRKHECFEQRVGSQTVGTVETRAGSFAAGIEMLDGGASVLVNADAAAEIMRRRDNGDGLFGDVDANRKTLRVNIREMLFKCLCISVSSVEKNIIVAVDFHLVVDGACHDVAGCKTAALVVFLHKGVAVLSLQNRTKTAHSLRYQIRRTLARMIERCRVELHKLHIVDDALCTIDHRNAVAGGNHRIGRYLIDVADAAGGEVGYLCENLLNLAGIDIESIDAITFNIVVVAGAGLAKVVLSDEFHRKQVVNHSDVWMLGGTLHEGALHLKTGVVLMVKDAEVAVSALLMKVEGAVGTAVEVDSVVHKILDSRRSLLHNNLNDVFLRQEVARHHSVVDVLLEGVGDVGNSRNAALRKIGVGIRYRSLCNNEYFANLRRFEGEGQTGNSTAYYKKICRAHNAFAF